MKRTRLIVLLLALAAMMFSSVAVSAQDDTSPNLLVAPLPADEVVEDYINQDFPFQLYMIRGNAGDVVTVSIEATSDDLDTLLVLLGPAGQVIAYDDDSGEGFNSVISEVELPLQGIYFVLASNFTVMTGSEITAEENLTYNIVMTGATGEAPEAADDSGKGEAASSDGEYQYFRGEVNFDEVFEGYSTLEEPIYYLIFNGTEGQTVTVEQVSDDFDTYMMLFAPGGVGIAFNDDDEGLGALDSAVRDVVLPTDGVYMIFATTYGFFRLDQDAEYEGGTFMLQLTGTEAAPEQAEEEESSSGK